MQLRLGRLELGELAVELLLLVGDEAAQVFGVGAYAEHDLVERRDVADVLRDLHGQRLVLRADVEVVADLRQGVV